MNNARSLKIRHETIMYRGIGANTLGTYYLGVDYNRAYSSFLMWAYNEHG